jgi:hypothetical protein
LKVPELQGGPLAVIGDVHGELEALEALLGEIERHTPARSLVFVGDLVDRGPDSPGVLRRVRALIDAGRAQLVLGNHELNLLRMDVEPKADNRWLRGEARQLGDSGALPEVCVTSEAERSELLAMLADVPVALEREDLRVVHAAWDNEALGRLTREADGAPTPGSGMIARHNASLERIREELRSTGLLERARAEARAIHAAYPIGVLGEESAAPSVSLAIQERELALQNSDPLRLVTSGPEAPTEEAFAAGGKWRHTRRARWWHDYAGPAVVFGHYWRGITRPGDGHRFPPPDPFAGEPEFGPLGEQKLAHCIDYSVGRRFLERLQGTQPAAFRGRLAALLWPEGELLFDDGQRVR